MCEAICYFIRRKNMSRDCFVEMTLVPRFEESIYLLHVDFVGFSSVSLHFGLVARSMLA